METFSLTIRRAGPDDRETITRLSQLDGKRNPSGEVLMALCGGVPIAALAVEDDLAIADPFTLSSEAVELLRLRAAQEHQTERRSWLRALRRGVSWRPAQAR